MSVHYKTGPNTVVCKARKGMRTKDIWKVSCRKCIDGLEYILRMEELRSK